MKTIPRGTPMIRVQIDRILESAVVLSWKDLVNPSSKRANRYRIRSCK
jgi:hypothetical protein